jgi:outer membrane protein insertion porin family
MPRVAAHVHICLRWFLLAAGVLLFHGLAAVSPAAAQSAVVENIQFVGNRRIPSATLQGRIFTRPGDVFNEDLLRRDFQALWNTQYFEDIRMEVEDSPDRPNAKVIVFYVSERPTIRRIEYCKLEDAAAIPVAGNCDTVGSVTESEILEKFKDQKVGLSVESRFDPTRIKQAENVLRGLLGEKGRQFAVIKPTYERIPATNAVILRFNINEGPKVKVGQIDIQGNAAFSDRRIIRSMRHSRPYAVPMWLFDWKVGSKTFDRRKLAEDQEIGIRGLYQDNGYFTVLVQDPELNTIDTLPGRGLHGFRCWFGIGLLCFPRFTPAKPGKATNITIPVTEGELWSMGKLFIRSDDPAKGLSFPVENLKTIFPIPEGDVFRVDRIRKSLEDYKKAYGEYGFIDFVSEPNFDFDEANKKIDLTLSFSEGKQFWVRRIEFAGNTTTRDNVIRREVLLDEGDLFNNRFWEVSLLRLNQLDYFEEVKAEHAEIKRNVREGSVDILLKVKEKGKQSIGLTGGISGVAGSFIGLSYQTNNFLGRGETMTFSAEFGDRQRNFLFGFTKPYIFDRPISSGFTIFSSRFSFDQARETGILLGRRISVGDPNSTQNYNQNSTGFTVFASYPLRRFAFTRVGLTYSLSKTSIDAFSDASQLLFELIQFRSFAGPSALQGITSSKIQPTITHNTVNHPINPTQGKSFFYAAGFEGGPIGGNVNSFTNVFEAKYFRPINKKRNVLGFRTLIAYGTGYGGQSLAPYARYYMGGEDTVRGFDIRNISPIAFIPVESAQQVFFFDPTQLDASGNPRLRSINVPVLDYSVTFPGGDSQIIGNAEYRIPLVGPVAMSLFFDVGLNGALRRNQLRLNETGLDNLRTKFPNATITNNLALASGTNFKLRTSTGIEFVVQLPVVNAPFRIYWAYNLNRVRQVLQEPRGTFNLNDPVFQGLPPGVLESQVLPQLNSGLDINARRLNFVEPLKTFRFTVSRTF